MAVILESGKIRACCVRVHYGTFINPAINNILIVIINILRAQHLTCVVNGE
jgi:hypothetical protein